MTPGVVRRAALALVLCAGGSGAALAGHTLGHYPSFYPDEIRIDVLNPAAAARALGEGTLHAYVGAVPAFAGPVPEHVSPVTSLGSFLVLTIDSTAPAFASAESRCAAARNILAELRRAEVAHFVVHPYPVTPYHADYLHHLDLIEAARGALLRGDTATPAVLTVNAEGPLAEAIVRTRWASAASSADVLLKEVTLAELLADVHTPLNDGLGPPWVKEGWFQAHRLLTSPVVAGPSGADEEIEQAYARLMRGEALDLAAHVNLERRLVAGLTRDCARMVLGYTVRQEYANGRFSDGIENIAVDSQTGLNAAVFLRTVKLKSYPWNGSLHLGVPARAEAGWNPVAGFTDATGRLVWSAMADPALIPFPFNASWIPNRVDFEASVTHGQSGGIKVPADALLPDPGTGALQPVGAWTFAAAKVLYEVLASPFQDGTEMAMADLLYPLVLACRWGGPHSDGQAPEPHLQAASAAIRERLAGLRPLRVESTAQPIAEGLEVIQSTPVLEVYIRDAPGDQHQVAALAPPWSAVPWHLLALMEEAVQRGYAAFSQEEARRRQTGWLDLVRDRSLQAHLLDLLTEFERDGWRPEALRDLVSAEEARARWRALKTFGETNGHFLVTNGPYRLKSWAPDFVVLQAVREATYPLGFGTFDRYVNPPRAVIREVARQPGRIVVRAEADMTLKVGREYRVEREALTRQTSHGLFGLLVVSRYVLIGPDGTVLDVDRMHWQDDSRFVIDLPQDLSPGQYTVALAIFLDGNSLLPSAKLLRLRVGVQGARS
jgi:hypothetical protein